MNNILDICAQSSLAFAAYANMAGSLDQDLIGLNYSSNHRWQLHSNNSKLAASILAVITQHGECQHEKLLRWSNS